MLTINILCSSFVTIMGDQYASEWFSNACQIQEPCHKLIQNSCHIATLVNGFREAATLVNGFRNPATLVNGFRMPVGFRNPHTSKSNLFSTTVKCWNTLTFVTESSFLDVTWFIPYTNWTLPRLWSSFLRQKLAASLLSQGAAF